MIVMQNQFLMNLLLHNLKDLLYKVSKKKMQDMFNCSFRMKT